MGSKRFYYQPIISAKQELQARESKYKQLASQLSKVNENGPRQIEKPIALGEGDLSCIEDDCVRKYTRLAYQALASEKKLGLLDLPTNELYEYQGDDYQGGAKGRVHGDLDSLSQEYYKDELLPTNHFGVVVRHLKALKKSDLNGLWKYCLESELGIAKCQILWAKDDLARAEDIHRNRVALVYRKAESFKPGDFSFLAEPLTIRLLSNAFMAVEKLDEWSFFDEEPPRGGYMFWSHPTLSKIGGELESDGHSGLTMAFTMRWMQRVRSKEWLTLVAEGLADNAKELRGANIEPMKEADKIRS